MIYLAALFLTLGVYLLAVLFVPPLAAAVIGLAVGAVYLAPARR